jgi:riboflavin biosynthesis pyrimidine reductase
MPHPQGPANPFQLLFADDSTDPPSLPDPFRAIYPGDWRMPRPANRPYIYTNFGISRDGRISYNEPALEGAYHVTKGDAHDRWLMGLLRMRADAVLMGDTTIRLEGYPLRTAADPVPWSAEAICPPDAAAFTAQRQAEGYAPLPLFVVLSFDGQVDLTAGCFTAPGRRVILATTKQGAVNARQAGISEQIDLLDLGEESADLTRLVELLYQDDGVRHLLCEGGSRVFANMLKWGLVDEEFVTWCPAFVGRSPDQHRPGYTEGVAWLPDNAPYSKPLSLHRGGDYLFLRTRCHYPT